MTTWPAIPIALAAAVAFATSSALKHVSADAADHGLVDRGGRGVLAFVRQTVRHPLWLSGIVADVVGATLQIIALHIGGLLLVQPLLVSALVIALVIRSRLPGGHLSGRQARWALALVLGLAVFVAAAQAGRVAQAPVADRLPSFVLSGVGAVLVVTALVVARRSRSGTVTAGVLGMAAGLLYAAAAALVTVVSLQFVDGGPLRILSRDEIYILVAVVATGQLLGQAAFQAGSLASSAPAASTADLLASVVLGVVVFDHPIPVSAWHVLLAVLSLVVVVAGVFVLTASEQKAPELDEPHSTRPL